jgi:serine/threonine protein kinase
MTTLYNTTTDTLIEMPEFSVFSWNGDLSTIINQATKQNRSIPEDTISHYFLQNFQALHHCYHPNGQRKLESGSAINGGLIDVEGDSRRVQILHRDLKPDNGSSSYIAQTIVSLIILLQYFLTRTTRSNWGILAFQKYSCRRASRAPTLGYVTARLRLLHLLINF